MTMAHTFAFAPNPNDIYPENLVNAPFANEEPVIVSGE